MRADADHFLLPYSSAFPPDIERTLPDSKLLPPFVNPGLVLCPGFDPASPSQWEALIGRLDETFLWLPWNWLTNKHALLRLKVIEHKLATWTVPARLRRDAVLLPPHPDS